MARCSRENGTASVSDSIRAPPAGEAGDPAEFACTLLLSRRLYPEAANHKLGTLVAFHGIEPTGRAHRALADAEVTAELWLRITRDVQRRYAAGTPFSLLCALQRAPKTGLAACAARYLVKSAASGLNRHPAA